MSHRNLLTIVLLAVALFGIAACGGGGGAAPANTGGALPAAPAGITADAGVSRVTLNWLNVADTTSFTIYYATSPGVTKANGTKIGDAHSPYVLRDLANGTTYYLAVASVGAAGEGGLSAEVSATPSPTPPPPAPANVRAAAGNGQALISWDASTGATFYTVYYRATPKVVKTDSKVTPAVSPQVVAPLANGTAYYFAVSATNANGEGALSFEVGATPLAGPPPAAPSGVTAVEGNGQATLTWNPSVGATAYSIYYGTEYGVTKVNGTKVTPAASPRVLGSLTNKTVYFFVVTAVNASGESADSAQVSATPLAVKPVSAMVSIPAGALKMGDNLLDPDAPAPYALPVHTANVSAFSIDRYETTYDLWKSVYDWAVDPARGASIYVFDSAGRNGSFTIGTNMPVTQVGWYDVVKWLNARSEMDGRAPVYYTDATQTVVYRTGRLDLPDGAVKWAANGYRLPTEAEWEWAARGGLAGKRYPWGDVLDASQANYDRGGSTSVGIYPANGYGIHDMAGNVWEWTWDWGSEADAYTWATDPITDPHGPGAGVTRVRRGGSYTYGARYLRCFERMFRVPLYEGPYFGFRSASSQP